MSEFLAMAPEPPQQPRRNGQPNPVPGYLVLFPRHHSAWMAVETMTGAVRTAAKHVDGSSAEILPVRRVGEAPIHVYERLGVAAMDLSPEERGVLESEGATVVENVVMRLPPAQPGNEAMALRAGVAATGQASVAWGIAAVGADVSPLAGSGIRVAVLDTGIDVIHPEFHGAIVAQRSFVTGVASVQDGHGHGTHVAGTIGARVTAGSPRYSVAPGCDLIIAKVLDDNGSGYTQWIVDGMNWAALDEDAHILNLSLGSSRAHNAPFLKFYEDVAERLLEAGVLTIAAAGNDSNRPYWVAPVGNPAACPSIDAVVAVDQVLGIAPFSCAGDAVANPDHSGPGVDIYSAWTGGGHHTISGTSMAAPHVSGLAALIAERTGLRGLALRNALHANSAARPIGPIPDYGQGLTTAPP